MSERRRRRPYYKYTRTDCRATPGGSRTRARPQGREEVGARGGRPAQDLRGDGRTPAGRPRRPQEEGFRSSEGGRGLRQGEPAAAAGAREGTGIPGPGRHRLQHERGRQ